MIRRIAVLVVAILMAAPVALAEEPLTPGYTVISQADVVRGQLGEAAPPVSANWVPISLPDNWNETQAGYGGYLWYRLAVPAAGIDPGSMAVLLPRLSMNAELWLDEHLIGDGGSMSVPVARNWHRPLYFPLHGLIPHDHQVHWIYIRVFSSPNDGGGIGAVYLGSHESLEPLYERAYFIDVTLSSAALVMTLVMTLALTTLWLLRRRQSLFGWMAASGGFWAIVIVNQLLLYPPLMSRYTWEWLVQSSISFYTLALLMVVHRFIGVVRPGLERAVAIYFVLTSAIAWLVGAEHLVEWFHIIHIGAIVTGAYLIWLCARIYWQTRQVRALGMLLAILSCLAIGVHDWLIIVLAEQMNTILIMQFGPPFVMLLIGGWMMIQFAAALDQQEQHKEEIERQIVVVSEELKREHEKRIELERRHIITGERERFTRELHDGMGGHLVGLKSILADSGSDQSRAMETLDQAILDMRLVIDAIGDASDDVGMVMGMLRSRLEHQLQVAGLAVSWNMQALPMQCQLQEGGGLHLLRIIQECITNVIRHAGADWVDVRIGLDPEKTGFISIVVSDNGCGMVKNDSGGRGLGNMHARSLMLGGELDIVSVPGSGTILRLSIPQLV
ncbi:MAG: hypothetical protein COW18_06795 [Zetaproteobacteria bacterium CG12_big_fil_rev_8_21_14_0_65_54_13]|nr:MAG: hypothetical protein COW18_06795 [Zetaproteobacteria bacterium CG12_big_fil_rev_8_21_14_0_65_54_13]PIX54604.1 MAG: hypothetical protein COZ50_07090 [Zetaproteobacteria bacterium CG_4_10_14_3_um_filter_54_28]PJA27721.1 MAG: hypothetical protein CO188_11605 [Zetaproteobacteria bacterium CG_4_9_14_3_um_filter_54_145]